MFSYYQRRPARVVITASKRRKQPAGTGKLFTEAALHGELHGNYRMARNC